ncbi:MAG: Ig-like domain-containing protein [Rhodothermales bacterium]
MRTGSFFSLALALAGLASCAIPVSPTGGPTDQTPAAVAASTPAAQSVNVDATSMHIVFSEYVDQASFAQAISITPEFPRPPVYRWRKKAVTIEFPEPLAENTTYIVTIDTKLRDMNRVALKQPITLAFATGPVINRGKIEGRVLDAEDGTPVGTVDIFAYAAPDSLIPAPLPDRPAYRTQTDDTGRFAFDFLSEQPYFVVALRDLNRNFRPDGVEPFGVPPDSLIRADTVSVPAERPWLLTQLDTIPPTLQRVRALSSRRLTLRFSESVLFTDTNPALWTVRDSVSQQQIPVEAVYLQQEDPRQVFVVTAPLFASRHLIVPGGLADSSLNAVSPAEVSFSPSAAPDTVQVRFVAFTPATTAQGAGPQVLFPGQWPGMRLSVAASADAVQRIASLVDSAGVAYPFTAGTRDGVTYALTPEPPIPPGTPFTLRIAGSEVGRPDTVLTHAYSFLSPSELGELSGVVQADSGLTGTPVIALMPYQTPPQPIPPVAADAEGRFLFSNLPAQTRYRFRTFLDRNGNMIWDGGAISPFSFAEPLHWSTDSLTVRARWETELGDTLRIR